MEYSLIITPIVSMGLLILALRFISKNSQKRESKMNKDDFIMCFPPYIGWFFLVLAIGLTIALAVLNLVITVVLVGNICLLLFTLLSYSIAYGVFRERVVVKGHTISITPFFGKTKHCTFGDITSVKEQPFGNGIVTYYVYTDKKLFSIVELVPGFGLFMQRIADAGIPIELC